MDDDIIRVPVESWDDVAFVMSGTHDDLDGDGVTLEATQLQPGENAVLELVVKGETKARFIQQGDD